MKNEKGNTKTVFPLSFLCSLFLIFHLLLHSLHSILHSFRVALHILTFEQGHIKFTKAVAEVYANQLRISSAPVVLNKTACFGVYKVFAGSEDIAPVN